MPLSLGEDTCKYSVSPCYCQGDEYLPTKVTFVFKTNSDSHTVRRTEPLPRARSQKFHFAPTQPRCMRARLSACHPRISNSCETCAMIVHSRLFWGVSAREMSYLGHTDAKAGIVPLVETQYIRQCSPPHSSERPRNPIFIGRIARQNIPMNPCVFPYSKTVFSTYHPVG